MRPGQSTLTHQASSLGLLFSFFHLHAIHSSSTLFFPLSISTLPSSIHLLPSSHFFLLPFPTHLLSSTYYITSLPRQVSVHPREDLHSHSGLSATAFFLVSSRTYFFTHTSSSFFFFLPSTSHFLPCSIHLLPPSRFFFLYLSKVILTSSIQGLFLFYPSDYSREDALTLIRDVSLVQRSLLSREFKSLLLLYSTSFISYFLHSFEPYIYSIPFFSHDFFFPFTLYSCSLTSIWSVREDEPILHHAALQRLALDSSPVLHYIHRRSSIYLPRESIQLLVASFSWVLLISLITGIVLFSWYQRDTTRQTKSPASD